MNFKSKILIISLLLILALSISAVCAGENTSDVQSTVEQNTSAVPATDESGGIDSSNSNYDSGNDVIGADSSKEELGATYTFKNLNLAVSTGSTNIQFGTSYVYDSAADTDINVNYGVRISRSGCTIDGKGYTIDGGGKSRIFTIETGVTIKNVVFVNWKNTAVYARGFDGNPTIKIINCTFKNPPASSGPAVAADHCSFVMDKCTFKDIESWNLNIVELTKLTFEVKNCKFEATRLSSFIAVGGAGNANRPTSGTLYNNTFTYSGPAYYGRPGVSLSNIYIDIEVNVTGCKFNNVDLGVGSKDYTYHEGPDTDALVNVDGCTFDMGRVTCNNHTEVNIHNSIIANNTYSAVEYTKNSKGVIDNCTFINNRKNTGNGAAVLSDANNVTLDIVNSRFINNTADLGGAIYIGEFSTATESNNTYINNIARGGGNSQNFRKSAQNQNIIYVGVGVNGTGSSLDDLANITFAVDDIKENGIIYFTNGTYGDVRCVRSSFKMLPYEGHTPYLTYVNARYSLGGRWLSNIEINNFSFKSTELCASLGESCKLLNCNFTNLNTTYGVSCDGANCIISNCTFINNNFSDGYYGGLIDVCNENVTISNCIFYNNTVYRGVVVLCLSEGPANNTNVYDTEFKDNIAYSSQITHTIYPDQHEIEFKFDNAILFLNALSYDKWYYENDYNLNFNLRNVTYWEMGKFRNTDIDGCNDTYQINVKFFDVTTGEKVLEYNTSTDYWFDTCVIGEIPDDEYIVVVSHPTGETRAVSDTFGYPETKEQSRLSLSYSSIISPSQYLRIQASINRDATGTVTYTVDGNDIPVTISNGRADLRLTEYLSIGKHEITVHYGGDDKYYHNTQKVTVYCKGPSTLDVDCPDIISPRDYLTITAYVNNDATGNVTFMVDNENYTRDVSNGKAILTLDKHLATGSYDINVSYNGNDGYYANSKIVSLLCKYSTDLDVDYSANITSNDDLFIIAYVNSTATGSITFNIDGADHIIQIVNGQAVLVLKQHLAIGEHDINISYSGDNDFQNQSKNIKLTVKAPTIPIINIFNNDIIEKDDKVNLIANANYNINSPFYFIILKDNVEIDRVAASYANDKFQYEYTFTQKGNYKISADYGTVDNLVINNGTVAVKLPSSISVNVSDVEYNNNAILNITVPVDATGALILAIGNTQDIIPLLNGHGKYIIHNAGKLPVGDYPVVVGYEGDNTYGQSIAYGSFKVNKITPTITINTPQNAVVGTPVTISFTTNSNSSRFTIKVNGKSVNNNTQYTPLQEGNCTINVEVEANEWYDSGYKSATFSVSPFVKTQTLVQITPIADVVVGTPVIISFATNSDSQIYVLTVNGVVHTNNTPYTPNKPGTYTISVAVPETDLYTDGIGLMTFEVTPYVKTEAIVNINPVTNVMEGTPVNIAFLTNSNSTNYVIKVNNNIINNNTEFTPASAGTYTITVELQENTWYTNGFNIATFTVTPRVKHNTSVIISPISDINVGEEATITFTTNSTGNQIIKVNGNVITGNKFTPTVAGVYTVAVEVLENDDYNYAFNTTSFTVGLAPVLNRYNSTVIIAPIVDAEIGKELTIDFTTNSTAGYVIKVNGVALESNKFTPTVAGVYTVTVEVLENDDYKYGFNTTSFTVGSVPVIGKLDPEVIITPINTVIEGTRVTISFTTTSNSTNYLLRVNGETFANNTSFTPDVGVYTVVVEVIGNEWYNTGVNVTTFTVKPLSSLIDPNMNLTYPSEVKAGDDVVVNVTLPSDVNELVYLLINNKVVASASVVNGKASFTIINVNENDTYMVRYGGNIKYKASNKYANLFPIDSKTSLPIPANSSDSPTFELTNLPKDANGNFSVYVDGVLNQTVEVINGTAPAITVKNLTPGTHDITLLFIDMGKYGTVSNSAPMNVTSKDHVITLVDNHDIPALYSEKATYSVRVLVDGLNIKDGEVVTIVFNGVTYSIKTVGGYASLDLNTELTVGNHVINASYGNATVTNNVVIKNIINAKKLKKLKKSKKVNKVKVSLVKVNGVYLNGKKLTLKIKGKKVATAKTKKKGVATFKVKKKKLKKFKKGKKVVATVTFGNDVVSKKIKIC